MDECRLNENICHPNATCKNIIGLYECHCLSGFDGDGFNCTGGLRIKYIQSEINYSHANPYINST